jgi:hypothetical protein
MKKREMHMRRFLSFIFSVVILALLLTFFRSYKDWREGKKSIQTAASENQVLSGMDEVAEALSEEIDSGSDGTVTLYISNVSEEELTQINFYLVTLYGTVDTLSILNQEDGISKVEFSIVRSDNYYVYNCYVNGRAIPADKTKAQELYNEVCRIMDSVIQPGMTDYQKELQLHDYLVNHCTYSFGSADNDNVYRAYGALVEGQAVCNGYAESMALLLSCAGVNNQVVTGWGDNDLHAWNLVEIDGDWYHLDATWDDPVGDEEVLSHAYFNVTDEIMEQRHVWQEEDYVSCDSMAANYFVQSQSYYTDYDSFTAGMSITAALDEDGWIECGIVGYDQDTYNLQFLYEVNGINSIRYAADGNEAFTVLTLYLNR